MRILIVEDEWMIAIRLEQTLEAAGLSVVGKAGSLDAAMSAVTSGGFDAVILDANLAGQSAEPIADLLHARLVPFVVVTGYTSHQRPGRLATAPFLRKPFTSTELLKLLSKISLDDTS